MQVWIGRSISRRYWQKNSGRFLHPTIISLPVQTAVCPALPVGALAVEVAIQLSVSGLYLAPVFKWGVGVGVGGGGPEAEFGLFRPPAFSEVLPSNPPHTIISLPAQTAV